MAAAVAQWLEGLPREREVVDSIPLKTKVFKTGNSSFPTWLSGLMWV